MGSGWRAKTDGMGGSAAQRAVGKHREREKSNDYKIRRVERISMRSSSMKEVKLWFCGRGLEAELEKSHHQES